MAWRWVGLTGRERLESTLYRCAASVVGVWACLHPYAAENVAVGVVVVLQL
jgi:hypothetical protein